MELNYEKNIMVRLAVIMAIVLGSCANEIEDGK